MNIVVNQDLKAYIDPLTADEHEALERSILAEGCRDALVLWGDMLVDGHNRYGICQKHGLPFQTVQNKRFASIDDVHLWMIDQHLGRRSVSDFQRGVLALRKREMLTARAAAATTTGADTGSPQQPPSPPLTSREDIAKAARISSGQVVMIEKIQKQAAPELLAAVKSGAISINAAAAVATLPAEEQAAAALAGKGELKQAARRVREAKRAEREEASPAASAVAEPGAVEVEVDMPNTFHGLQQRVTQLTAENHALRLRVAELEARG